MTASLAVRSETRRSGHPAERDPVPDDMLARIRDFVRDHPHSEVRLVWRDAVLESVQFREHWRRQRTSTGTVLHSA
jgi:hypothetical protein